MRDPRIMSADERIKAVLEEMKPLVGKGIMDQPIWCAHAGNVVRWMQILAGERIVPVDMAGDHHTLCKECGEIVWDVYVLPRPAKGICQLCCKHKLPDRDNRGSCKICEKECK